MNTSKNINFWMICSFIIMAAFNAHATTVHYSLDNVILADGEQITGTFDWTFSVDDFEGGSGVFTTLEIPWTTKYNFADGNLTIDIQTGSIEITGDGNYHDAGLGVSLKFPSQPFTPTQSASIDLTLSKFECCGNGFKDQPFLSGNIVPSTVLAGDFNNSGLVDVDDLNLVLFHWNEPAPDEWVNMVPAGVVGVAELNGVLFNWNNSAAVAVPEPASALLILFAMGACVHGFKP